MTGRIFKAKKIKEQPTLGERLRQARLKRGLSLSEVAGMIKIREEYLKNIEKSRYDKLPADVYARGFLKSYADFLGANSKKVIELYKRESKMIKNPDGQENIDLNKRKIGFLILTPRMIKIFFILLLIGSIVAYLWYQIKIFSASPLLTVTDPSWDKTIQDTQIVVTGQTDADVDLLINGQKVFVDLEGRFREDVSLQRGINNIRIVARNKIGKETAIERKVMVDISDQQSNTNSDELQPVHDGLEIEIQIKEKATWVNVEADKETAYSGTMLPDSVQIIKAKNEIKLSSGKAEATKIIFNGKDLGYLGEEGEAIRDMIFTKDMILEGNVD